MLEMIRGCVGSLQGLEDHCKVPEPRKRGWFAARECQMSWPREVLDEAKFPETRHRKERSDELKMMKNREKNIKPRAQLEN